MPTYAYRCTECGHEFDTYQSFTDAALTECPECHGVLRKVLHPVGVVFKGSGFYRNDSRSTSSSTSPAATSSKDSSSSASKDSGSKESSSSTSSPAKESSSTSSTSTTSTTTTAKPAAS